MTTTTRSTEAKPKAPVPQSFLDEMVEDGPYTTEQIAHAVEVAPPRWATPAPVGDTIEFDHDEVWRVWLALKSLRHTKTRRWLGSPFVPEAWQLIWIIAPVFGWRYTVDHPDAELAGTRVARTAYIEIPRKNGKSTLVSALLIYLLCADGEAAPEVYTAASDKTQAGIILGGAKDMARASPALRRKIPAKDLQAQLMRYRRNNGILRALSKIAEAAHGLNVSGGAIDELHVIRNRGLVDAILTGTGARAQPLVCIVTTADEGDEHSVYAEQHGMTVRLAEDVYKHPSHYGVIWAAPDKADPLDDDTLARCNPGAGVTVTWNYLRTEANKARNEPSYLPTFSRLQCNIRERSVARLIPMADWNHHDAVQMLDRDRLYTLPAFGGLDLSATSDFTAFVALVGPAGDTDMFDVVAKFWLPEDRVAEIERQCRVPIARWIKDGWIKTTEGNTVDYRKVRTDITQLRGDPGKGLQLMRIGYDPWQANETVQELGEAGFAMVPVRQGYASLSAPTKRVERAVLEHQWRHGGNPVLTWMASCVDVKRDDNGNVRPVKPEIDKSSARIDGISASLMGVFCWLKHGTGTTQRRKLRARSVR